MRDIITEIWATASRNKLRTTLTGFAVAWGIFMLIFLLGAGNGLINAQMKNNNRFVGNSMKVFGGQTSKPYKGYKEGRVFTLKAQDIKTTEQKFTENIDEVGAQLQMSGDTISYKENYFNSSVYGVYPNEAPMSKIEMLYGRFINDIDLRQSRKSLVISDSQAKVLDSLNVEGLIGKYIKVNNIAFLVVGIYKADQSQMNENVYTAYTTVRTMYSKGDDAGTIQFTFHGLPDQKANEAFEKKYRAAINTNHDVAPDDESALWIWNRFTQSLQMQTGVSVIRTALWIVGLFTLLSGIVGVSNIMLITVKERTREFGIRKAIGAKPSSILRLVIIESIIITTIFGYVGMVFGLLANQYMDATAGHKTIDTGLFQIQMFLNPTVGLDVCVGALIVLVIAGTIAGFVPARKAARIRPIEALSAE